MAALSGDYPPGAEHDPRAPYNEPDGDGECAYCGEPCDGELWSCHEDQQADMRDDIYD